MTIAAGTKLGPYEIVAPIGAGGMGEVYRARDTRLGRDVAVKVLPEGFARDAERLARFEREAKALAALNHPNILSVFDVGSHGGAPYVVMELLEGETLRRRLSGGPLPAAAVSKVAAQMAEGLAAAHERGIVHRDLKPDNVFLTKTGHVKILDFGLARVGEAREAPGAAAPQDDTAEMGTTPGTVVGTIGYMAPEQARGLSADARSDVFAFGAVLYEILSGKRAFPGETASDVLAAILLKDPAPLPQAGSQGLGRVLERCLEKRPEERFASGRDLAAALEAEASAPPAQAQTDAAARRLGSAARNAALAVSAALLLAVLILGLWSWRGRHAGPSPPPAGVTPKTVAVFPLEDLSNDPEKAYFAPGMTEALTTRLTQIRSLRVLGSATAERCKRDATPLPRMAEVFGVDAVVEGTVLRVGDTVRISVRLLDARSDSNLWAESYDRRMADVLALQGEVAQAIAASVRAAVSPGEREKLSPRPVDPRAYDEYLGGVYDYLRSPGNEGLLAAIAHFTRAVELDPGFAPAHERLSRCYEVQFVMNYVPYEVAHPRAKAAALKAVELAPSLASARAGLANVLESMERDLPGATREIEAALALDPGDPLVLLEHADILCVTGRYEEAIAIRRRCADLDPLSPGAWSGVAEACAAAGRWDEAVAAYQRSLELGFADPAYIFGSMGFICAAKGDVEKAYDYADEVRAVPGWEKEWYAVAYLAQIDAMTGRRGEAREMLRRLEPMRIGTSGEEMDLGFVYAWLGEKDRALDHLGKACSLPGFFPFQIGFYPYPEPFRKDPRFLALVRKVGVPLRR